MQSKTTRGGKSASRALTVIAAVVATAAALTGCSGGGASAGSSADGKTTLDFWNGFTGPDQPVLQKVIDNFNASQDKIEVKNNPMPWDVIYDKALTAMTGGDGPDILALPAERVPGYAEQGALTDISGYYDDSANETEQLAAPAIAGGEYGGKHYGVPVSYSNIMMYWNKDLFAKAGYSAPPATWDEFASMVPKLTVDENGDGKPEQYAIALADHETLAMFPPLLWAGGGGVVSQDGKTSLLGDDETISAAQFWVDLIRNQKASPVGLGGGDADKLFTTGKAAIELVGPWMTTGFDEAGLNYDVAKPMTGPGGDVALAIATEMTVPSSADDATKQAAYEFFKFLNTTDQQKVWAGGTGFPPNRVDIPAADLSENKWSAVFGDPEVAKTAQLYLAGTVDYAKINDSLFVPALQKALNGDGAVADLFPEASDQIQALLDK